MAKLYPPNIGGTIPAFCRNSSGTVILTVPFSMNRAVARAEVAGFVLKLKTVNGTYLATINAVINNTTGTPYDIIDRMEVDFDVTNVTGLNLGQYYKVQMAYINQNNEVGYFSTVGVAKYTAQPQVSIKNLSFGKINSHEYQYTGVYSQLNGDPSEKMYSCRFKLLDEDENIIEDSGDIIHNTMNDDLRYESHEVFTISRDLSSEKSYYIIFTVTTNNELTISTPRYRIMQRRSINPEIIVDLKAELNYDNGYIKLTMNNEKDSIISGTFLIARACSKDGYVWEEFKRFDMQSMVPSMWSLMDCTLEQGVTYKYSLQQYNNNGVYSDRIVSNECYADFEDAFLYDGEKQLRIRFDPKVSSFKNDLLESKVETIGSTHPYILRNGNVNYKEFPIAGLISYQMDEDGLFCSKRTLGISANITDLTSENIKAERVFKLKALEWLTDGKAKLFRSPTEGNYIVRLLNVSLSPNDTLGRMLHSFSATAYEVAKFNTQSLGDYGLIDPAENLTTQTRWASVDLREFYIKLKADADANKKPLGNKLGPINTRQIYSVTFTDMMPGSIVYIGDTSIEIGVTGAYIIESSSPITYLGVDNFSAQQGGICTYSYQTKTVNVFSTITEVEVEDIPCKQIIGQDYLYKANDLISSLTDTRTHILQVPFGRFIKRTVKDIYIDIDNPKDVYIGIKDCNYYWDMDCKDMIDEFDPLTLYHVRCHRTAGSRQNFLNEGYYVDANKDVFAPYTDFIIDGNHPKELIKITNDIFYLEIGEEIIDLDETEKYILKDVDNYSLKIKPHLGVISEISYSRQIAKYSFEEEQATNEVYDAVYKAKQDYNKKASDYERNILGGVNADSNYLVDGVSYDFRIIIGNKTPEVLLAEAKNRDIGIKGLKKIVDDKYNYYIKCLDAAIKYYKKINGLVE